MGTFVKVILIIVIVLYILGQIGRFLLKRVLKNFVNSELERQKRMYAEEEKRNYKEGEIHIDHIPEEEISKRKNSKKFKDGDYVDYKEVD